MSLPKSHDPCPLCPTSRLVAPRYDVRTVRCVPNHAGPDFGDRWGEEFAVHTFEEVENANDLLASVRSWAHGDRYRWDGLPYR